MRLSVCVGKGVQVLQQQAHHQHVLLRGCERLLRGRAAGQSGRGSRPGPTTPHPALWPCLCPTPADGTRALGLSPTKREACTGAWTACQQTDPPGASVHFSSPFLHPLQVTWVPHLLTSQGMESRGRSRPGAHPDLDSGSPVCPPCPTRACGDSSPRPRASPSRWDPAPPPATGPPFHLMDVAGWGLSPGWPFPCC